jgi:hypothetical protein
MTVFDPVLRLLFWSAFYFGAARIGAWLTRSELRGIAHLAWDGLTGLPVLIAAWLAIGLFRFDRPSIAVSFALLLGITVLRVWIDPVARFTSIKLHATDRPTWVAIGLLVAMVAVGLAWNRVPVLFYDSLAYHFGQPELWLLEGRIAPYDWNLHSWFPPGMSVLYGIGLASGGEAWANDANLMIGVTLCLAIFDLARRSWSPWAGLLALGSLLAVPQILFALSIPAADLAHGTFVAGALGALMLAHLDPHGAWSRRAAWIAAGALLTKYLGILVPLGAGALFVGLSASRNTPFARRCLAAVRFCAPALLLLLPWFVANAVAVGNPFAPMFANWLPIDGLASGGELAFMRDARGGLPGLAELRALGPRLWGPASLGIYPGPAWGWPVAVWIAAAVLGAVRDTAVRRALAIAAGLFAVWFVTFRWERFLIATTFFLCLAFSGAVWLTARRPRVWRLLALAALVAGLAYSPTTLASIARYSGGSEVFLGREDPGAFLRRSWPQQRLVLHEAVVWNPATDRLLLVGEARHYRIPVRRVAPTGFNLHPFAIEFENASAVEQIHRGLRRRGFTHLLIDLDWIERSSRDYPSLRALREAPEKLRAYLDSLGPPLASAGRRALFRIPETP